MSCTGALSALRGIYREGGVRGLFTGTKAACIRIAVASPTQLVAYDVAKVCCHNDLVNLSILNELSLFCSEM
jgi:hypothetical protein